jgi:hypothetical protein
MADCMLFYVLTSQSWYVRDSVYGKYLRTFKIFFVGTFVTMAVDAGASVAAVLVPQVKGEVLLDKPWYFALNFACQLMYALHLVCAAWATGQVLQRHHWQLQPFA